MQISSANLIAAQQAAQRALAAKQTAQAAPGFSAALADFAPPAAKAPQAASAPASAAPAAATSSQPMRLGQHINITV